MTQPELLTKRNLAKTKRQFTSMGKDIQNIRAKGFAALSSTSERGLFRGMFATLPDLFKDFQAKWEEAYDYNGLPDVTQFPTAEEENYLQQIKQYYYEAHNYYQQIYPKHGPAEPGSSAHDATINSGLHGAGRAVLPKIHLKTFDGDLTQWPPFKQLFLSLVKDDSDLSDATKFHYLVGCLKGQAYDAVKHIAAVGENFEQAWAVLLRIYDDPRKLASAYLKRFLGFRPQTGKPSAESLQAYISNVSESIASLRNLNIPNLAEYLLCELALRALDPTTREAFETSIIGTQYPTFTELKTFVENRCQVLRLTSGDLELPSMSGNEHVKPYLAPPKAPKPPNHYTSRTPQRHAFMAQTAAPTSPPPPSFSKMKSCFVCEKNHTISACPRFREANPQTRVSLLRQFRGCRNCLSVNHQTLECTSIYSCRSCGKRHHTDLHLPGANRDAQPEVSHQPTTAPPTRPAAGSSGFAGNLTEKRSGVLLGTIVARLQSSHGDSIEFRGLVDPGSQYSFLTEDCARKLQLPIAARKIQISGVNGSPLTNVKGTAPATFVPTLATASLYTEAVVIPSITPRLPQVKLRSSKWEAYLAYDLSDRSFAQPGPISFLIGADLFPEIITGPPKVVFDDGPRLLPTVFGMTVIGRFHEDIDAPESLALFAHSDLASLMERFWEVEEPSFVPTTSPEDEICEKYFLETHQRSEGGRYIVSLPFKTRPPNIVPNQQRATSYFMSLEARLSKNLDLQAEYRAQMAEYQTLGHMKRTDDPAGYIIPHHAVLKQVGDVKKVRVVFDASFRTTTGSLNDHLLTGPKLQADLTTILLKFRAHQYVFSCDIIKMFRQIGLHPDDHRYLQILWRDNPQAPLERFALTTVTFGLSCSPYLAQRVLQQHATNYRDQYPEAAQIVQYNTYIDDITAGSDSLSHLIRIKTQLIEMLRHGGFELSKWSSNHTSLLETPSNDQRPVRLGAETTETTKILGIHWDPVADTFSYEISAPPPGLTRRILLSSIARLYDPLGYLAPIVFQAKHLLQRTWAANLQWDEELPNDIATTWLKFVKELPNVARISIHRPFPSSPSHSNRQLLVFGDASAIGYCAVAYLRTTSESGRVEMTLLKAKTKLAPLKTLTIPRLELCAAVLVSRLIKSLDSLKEMLKIDHVYCFTDSSTVLAWLNISPHQLQVFVGNRTQQILSVTELGWWSHIRGCENPADVGSRGVSPASLESHTLWWTGPSWCQLPTDQWPNSTVFSSTEPVPEVKKSAKVFLTLTSTLCPTFLDFAKRRSKYPGLVRTVAYMKRFLRNARITQENRQLRTVGPISAAEFEDASLHYIQLLQHQLYPEIFTKTFNQLSPELRRLNVFLDPEGMARVGGRLANAPVSFERKHPILLPRRSYFTNLIVDHYHHQNHHAGPASLLASIRLKYWIPGARALIKSLRHKCVVCVRFSRSGVIPFMGELPKSRFSSVRAFYITGVDFAGPFLYRTSQARKAPVQKAYLCLFICMSTRAMHLEIALGLSVEAFLDAFDRFVNRRGLPFEMLSDGGTNFRGTDRYLRELIDLLGQKESREKIIESTAPRGVKWSFNPPSSPHFGGGWEVAVRMVKDLLFKTFGNRPYTADELTTAFVKIEGILNSRPLQPLSGSPDDLEPLTPGHFLIGQPISALPEPDLSGIPPGRLNRWQHVRERVQYFWTRWKEEYLSSLQVRQKWDKQTPNVRVDDLVLLRDANSSPTKWPLGRVVDVHPGQDQIVRVVTVRTASGTYKRPAVKLVRLSLSDIHA